MLTINIDIEYTPAFKIVEASKVLRKVNTPKFVMIEVPLGVLIERIKLLEAIMQEIGNGLQNRFQEQFGINLIDKYKYYYRKEIEESMKCLTSKLCQ
jgi:hypothetical protein